MDKPEFCTSPTPTDASEDSISTGSGSFGEDVSSFLDLAYWKRLVFYLHQQLIDINTALVIQGLHIYGEVVPSHYL